MNLHLTASEQAFQASARAFLAAHWDAGANLLPGPRRWAAERRYLAALAAQGWLVGHWPRADGGAGWSERERWLWEREAAQWGAPQPSVQGPDLLGPLLRRVGSAAQRRVHLPGISSGRVRWCQAFAEDSGAVDLPAISTVARPHKSGYLLSGTKPWVLDVATAGALAGNSLYSEIWMYVLAEIAGHAEPDGAAALGIFLVPASAPGVSIEPRPMIGESTAEPMVSAVGYQQVNLPADALLGEVGAGADYALELEQEELALTGSLQRNAVLYQRLRDFVAAGEADGGSLWADEDYVAKLLAVEVQLEALSALEARAYDSPAGDSAAAERAAFSRAARLALAVRSAELSQTLADLQVEALGYFALPMVDFAALDNEGSIGPEFAQPALLGMLSDRARGVIGAPREHLKNIIAKSVLELPDTQETSANKGQSAGAAGSG